ncbi:hypothetical protein [Flavobacterium sp. GCM10027622]|uniref:hypothetical protein n=1 Tax=unclassified Flavobacterium TaxID=196869 RepID=UPI00360E4AC5
MKKQNYLIYGSILVVALWIISCIIIKIVIPNPTEQGQFGDMFGAVNSLFSGLALCGVAYTVYLQYESNKQSQQQFKFNHLLDTINKQIEVFNRRIEEFTFNLHTYSDLNKVKFSKAMEIYEKWEDDDSQQRLFNDINQDTINDLLPFIGHSFDFIFDLIKREEIEDSEKEKLKSLFKRSINRNLIQFLKVSAYNVKIEEKDLENSIPDLLEIEKGIIEIKKSMITQIINDYR